MTIPFLQCDSENKGFRVKRNMLHDIATLTDEAEWRCTQSRSAYLPDENCYKSLDTL